MDEADKDAYIIEYEKCKVIKLCILDKFNEKYCKNLPFLSEDERRLHEVIYDTESKYTYLQLVEELKKLL